MPSWKQYLKATAQLGMGTAWYVWISIGHPETACGRPAHVRPLPATTRNSTKVVTRRVAGGLAFRIFPCTTRIFTKDTALSENGMDAAWHVWISLNAASPNSISFELSQVMWRFTRSDTDYNYGDRTPVFLAWFRAVLICYNRWNVSLERSVHNWTRFWLLQQTVHFRLFSHVKRYVGSILIKAHW
jgi:hypothetical protein